jgi:hypothetical protein
MTGYTGNPAPADTAALMIPDFEHWHPLDHSVGSRRCKTLYGGRRRHMRLLWENNVYDGVRIWTFCLLGKHRYMEHWELRDGHTAELHPSCYYCDTPLPGRHAKLRQ